MIFVVNGARVGFPMERIAPCRKTKKIRRTVNNGHVQERQIFEEK